MRTISIALMALAVFVAPATAGVVSGGTGGGTMFLKDGDVSLVGEVIGDIGYRFPYYSGAEGEISLLYGAQVSAGESLGMMYRHLLDPVEGNLVKVGLGAGFFGLTTGELSALTETTVFAGGGPALSLGLASGELLAYAEYWHAVAGDDASMIRFGIRAALAP